MESNILYSIQVTQKKKGQTGIYRHPKAKFGLQRPPFDNMRSFWNLSKTKFPKNKCLQNYTYEQIDKMATYFGSWLLKNNNKVLYIHSKNRWEWCLSDIGCIKYGIISVPLYDTLGKVAMQHTLQLTQGSTIVSSQQTLNNVLTYNLSNLSNIKTIVLLDDIKPEHLQKLETLKINTIKFQDILNLKLILQQPEIKPTDPFSICFTSGTTGLPKGAIKSHYNFASQLYNIKETLPFVDTDVHISYLPLAHSFQRCVHYSVLQEGAQIRYFSGSMLQLPKDFARIKPTIIPIVPRLLNMFYASLKNFSHVDKKLAEEAWRVKEQNFKKGILTSPYDDTVFKVVRGLFGGRVRFLVTGSAPVSAQVLHFYRVALGCDVRQGYGQTETMSASFVTAKNESVAGHVGGPNPSLQFKLVDIPQMNYSSENNPPTGEICLRGYSIFPGYYKDEKNTKEAIDQEGWLHTGDVGVILPNGALKIIDRKKNIYKLSQGQYIAPQKIQNIYLRNPLISQIFIYGDSLQSFNIAIIFPNKQALQKLAISKGIQGKFEQLCQNSTIVNIVNEILSQFVKKQGLQGFQIAKKIKLHHTSFVGYGIFTSTLKMQRHIAKQVFQKQIDNLYSRN